MGVRFCVLGSGSSGNATLVMSPGANVLIDAGFSPDETARRMEGTGVDWGSISAIAITHTHGDHLKKRILKCATDNAIPFFCHASHLSELENGRYMKRLLKADLVNTFTDEPFEVADEFLFHPLHVPHDAVPTVGFKIETTDQQGCLRRMGYLCDLGHWTEDIAYQLRNVELLALEFNHDVEMQRNSGRHPRLIARVLGRRGHLSNVQASQILERILQTCDNGGPHKLIQMHLSQECNRPDLAYQEAHRVIQEMGAQIRIYSSKQNQRGRIHELG